MLQVSIDNRAPAFLKAKAASGLDEQTLLQAALKAGLDQIAKKASKVKPIEIDEIITEEQCYQTRLRAKKSGMKLNLTDEHKRIGLTEEMIWGL